MSIEELDDEIEIERENLEEPCNESEESTRIPPWTKQITVRGIIVSVVIGTVYTVIVMKLYLTTGLLPNLNISAALLAFVSLGSWKKVIQRAGFVSVPFTKQETTMVQTCAVACYSLVNGGGFGAYLLGLNKKTYELAGVDTPGNSPGSYKEPGIGWMTGYLFIVSFAGLFVLIPLRKIMIVDYKLTFPTGTATAALINGFHKRGDKIAKKQVRGFLKFFSMSFLWGFFQWFYTGKGQCGFLQFPTFGLQAWKKTFYFDFSLTYVGTGMICSHIVNLSLLLGAVLSWGLMWPLIDGRKGNWFPETLPESSMKSLNGYKVFITIGLTLGDGLYYSIKILGFMLINICGRLRDRNLRISAVDQNKAIEDKTQNEIFIKESIPMWFGVSGYIIFSIISIIAIPFMFPQLKWYYVLLAYVVTPFIAFCNAYGSGLTDMNMAYNYGKVALFVLAALSGKENGVVAGLVGCGIIKSIVNVSCTLMQDLKTAHFTLTSSRTMFLSQVIGTALGCVVAPLSFFLFYNSFDVGNPYGEYKAPYAIIYRNMAIIGVEGFSSLPHHCLQLFYGFFAFAIVLNLMRDVSPKKIGKWMPIPTAMAVPLLVGAFFAIDMCVGSLVVFMLHKLSAKKADLMVPAIASGLICGEGMWILPSTVLAMAKVKPPICMTFLAS